MHINASNHANAFNVIIRPHKPAKLGTTVTLTLINQAISTPKSIIPLHK
ncbi:F22G5.12 [Arabidopsis thaliana]|uniref:F22G5.12 n=1 Tax=Arabidopsis thaliana TaxID=3702 RepID=Q9LNX3_ARATH|nr:F22G5.12 [Arabidopsis thaliana]